MDEILADFVAESRENLDRVEQELIELEKDPAQSGRIAAIFRAIHTIKGTCGFFDLRRLESVAHAGENLLSILRDGRQTFSQGHATILLEVVDAIRSMIVRVESSGTEGEESYLGLIERLAALTAGDAPAPGPPAARAPTAAVSPDQAKAASAAAEAEPASPSSATVAGTAAKAASAPRARNFGLKGRKRSAAAPSAPGPTPPLAPRPAEPEPEPTPASAQATPLGSGQLAAKEDAPAPENLATPRTAEVGAVPPDTTQVAKPGEPPGAPRTTTIRVDVAVLDSIMNLVGELVLARNQLLELTNQEVRSALALTCQRIDQVTTELQGSVMKTRMQPISTVWNKFPRVARELGAQCGKRVRVDLEGSETELDKTVLEAISEPLSHLIRNGVDHGLESPAARVAAGKPAEGRLRLSASHQGGHVFIEIADDGAGIDLERVRRKAVEKGIATRQQVERMSTRDVTALIFAPGFSTAEKVTNISGRGVGMDVVRTNIERIGGSVDMISEEGVGTTCRVRLPLTLAIVPAIIVAAAGQRFAIPQLGLQELVRVRRDTNAIEHVHGAPVYRLRGHLLPLVWLGEVLGLKQLSLAEKLTGTGGHILVLQVENRSFGLVVDEVTNSEEIVVKPMADLLSGLDVYAGTTILGDGQVALILDAGNLVARARAGEGKAHHVQEEPPPVVASETTLSSYVLCGFTGNARVAVPLAQVERLEKFKVGAIESRNGRAALQYRGEVIGLFRMEDGLDGAEDLEGYADDNGLVHALVYREGGRRVGVAVRRILDIVDCADPSVAAGGVAVINERVTTIADLASVVHERAGFSFADAPVEAGLPA